jgi:hypothetical protein
MAYSTIIKPNTQMNPVLYTGNEATNAITTGLANDFVWVKAKDSAGVNHYLFDSVRGVQKNMHSNNNDAEVTEANTLTAFNSTGFTLGSDAQVNGSGQPHISWNWKAGGTASTNTDGSIDSQVSVNTTAGFSIVSYTAPSGINTIGHGLGVTPNIIIVKVRDEVSAWIWGQDKLGWSNRLLLNATNVTGSEPRFFYANSQEPNATTWSADQNAYGNANAPMIAYCFAEKKGYSKFGTYQGNTSVDGTFLYLGFKPAFLLVKGTTTAESWIMFDNQRGNQGVRANPQDLRLLANANNAEADIDIDFLSNGVKFRTTENAVDHANTYMYMAFAENPLVANTSGGIPTTAR